MSDTGRFQVVSLADIDWEAERAKAEAEFLGARYGEPRDANEKALTDIRDALQTGREEDIQVALSTHPYAFRYAIAGSGHHGTWAFPKQMIKPRSADGSKGIIPDFLVATLSSLGYFWHVVEIKRFDARFSNKSGTGLSQEASLAITQCNRYLAHFRDYIDAVRSSIRVNELVQPSGAVLIIGDSATESDAQRQVRSEFVRSRNNIDVVSYRRILRGLESDIESRRH
jgi:hypothetical protein